MEMLKRKLKFLAVCFAVLIVIVAIRVAYEQHDSRRVINDDTLEREITEIVHNFPEAPNVEEKVRPWDSELPALVSKDIEYLENDPSLNWIEYKFHEWRIYIRVDGDGNPYISMDGTGHPYLYDFSNFSFYSTEKNGKSALVLYGYDLNSFETYTFYEGDYDYDHLTYNKTIPFTEKESFAYTRGDYTVCFPDDRDVVYVYKDGLIVSDEYVIEPSIHKMWNGLIISKTCELEMLYVVENEEGKVEIRFEPVGKLKDSYERYSSIKVEGIDELYVEIPVFNENDRMIVAAPKDWDTYIATRKGETPENPNYGMELIPLDKSTFKRVEFECHKSGGLTEHTWWVAYIVFDINGREIRYSYTVNGYDKDMPCPSELPEKKTVTTEGEFWDFITTIRETYKLYYDYPDGE